MGKEKADRPRVSLKIHKPRKRTFNFSLHSRPASRMPKDDRTVKTSGPQIELVRPSWTGATPTTMRVYPNFCAENPSDFDPTRLGTGTYDFSDWIRSAPAVKYVGIDEKLTFLLYDQRNTATGYERNSNPYIVLYNAITNAVKEGEAIVKGRDVITAKWAPLVSPTSKKKAFNKPTTLFFVQGAIYEHNGELYIKGGNLPKGINEGDLPQIVQLSSSAGHGLSKQIDELVDGYNGSTENLEEMFVHGKLTSLEEGEFVTIYNPEKHEVYSGNDEDEDEEDDNSAADDDEDENPGFKGWKVKISKTFRYAAKRKFRTTGGDLSEHHPTIYSRLQWWDDILHFPEHDQLCLWLASAFRSMPNLLYFGWADNREFFTDEVKGILANRVQGAGAEIPGGNDDDSSADSSDSTDDSYDSPDPKSRLKSKAKRTSVTLKYEDESDTDDDDEDEDEDNEENEEEEVDDSTLDEYVEDEYEEEDDDEEDEDEDPPFDTVDDSDEEDDEEDDEAEAPAPSDKKSENEAEEELRKAIANADRRAIKRPVTKPVVEPKTKAVLVKAKRPSVAEVAPKKLKKRKKI